MSSNYALLLSEEQLERKIREIVKECSPLPEKEILNIQEASNLTGYAVQTLYYKIHKRQIPHIKRGSRVFFDRSKLLAWLRENNRPTIKEKINEQKSRLRK